MNLLKLKSTPLVELASELFLEKEVEVFIKRDELNHPAIQGNKAHKLKLNLAKALEEKAELIISFGGAYSNHLYALAAATRELGIPSLGIVRGLELPDNPDKWSPTLKKIAKWGMELKFISREEYRQRNLPEYLKQLTKDYPQAYILPEGGTNSLALEGFADLAQEIRHQLPDFTHLLTSVGTGGTLAGLAKYLPDKKIIGIAALKQADYLIEEVTKLIEVEQNNWELKTQYHGGGFGKITQEIQEVKDNFEEKHSIKLDRVYTAKMVNAFYQMLNNNEFPAGSKIILYHSGGLQGS